MLRGAMVVTDLATLAFLAVQTPALIQLLNRHHVLVDSEGGTALYGLIFMLVLVHAGHVLGGLPPLAVVTANVFRDRYDHEDHRGLSYVAGYWHFLDVVWLVLFGVLVFTA
jgi:heme/copper-type cytochrome/quinol oxidase subunit 3